jgi:hypothetical protein
MKIILIKLKWKYLRYLAKRNRISFQKMMFRIYCIQRLEKLPNYNLEQLAWLSNKKLIKLLIKEFPNEKIPNLNIIH